MRPFKPAYGKSDPAIDEERFLRAARAYARRRFPNPERKGCPPASDLDAMARRQSPLSGIGGLAGHIATCSPCLGEYLAAREKWKRRTRQLIAVLATAAGLVILIAGASLLRSPAPVPPSAPPSVIERRPPDIVRSATLDLRPLEPVRGEPNVQVPVPALDRGNLKLTILLPVGSEEGRYEFQVRDKTNSPIVQGIAAAVIRNYVTTIETDVDLRGLDPGSFTWAIRRAGESSWRTYPLKVQ
jgi:hypothetical protein